MGCGGSERATVVMTMVFAAGLAGIVAPEGIGDRTDDDDDDDDADELKSRLESRPFGKGRLSHEEQRKTKWHNNDDERSCQMDRDPRMMEIVQGRGKIRWEEVNFFQTNI